MLINKLDNTNKYLIKLLDNQIDIYNPLELEAITKKIIKKLTNKTKLNSLIMLEFYSNKEYGTLIILKNIKKHINTNNEIEVKIKVHIDTPFLYKLDYFTIKENNLDKENIYYYKNNFYLELKNTITKKEYLNLLEISEVVYENTFNIINKGIKIKV